MPLALGPAFEFKSSLREQRAFSVSYNVSSPLTHIGGRPSMPSLGYYFFSPTPARAPRRDLHPRRQQRCRLVCPLVLSLERHISSHAGSRWRRRVMSSSAAVLCRVSCRCFHLAGSHYLLPFTALRISCIGEKGISHYTGWQPRTEYYCD